MQMNGFERHRLLSKFYQASRFVKTEQMMPLREKLFQLASLVQLVRQLC